MIPRLLKGMTVTYYTLPLRSEDILSHQILKALFHYAILNFSEITNNILMTIKILQIKIPKTAMRVQVYRYTSMIFCHSNKGKQLL